MSHSSRIYRRVIVQRAAEWPTTDGDWTTVGRATATSGEECLLPDIGSAGIKMAVGTHKQPLALTVASAGPDTALQGRYVRLLIQDDSADVSITLNDLAERYRPFWWGIVVDISQPRWSAPAANGISTGFASWTCLGLAADLDVQPDRGFELGSDGASPIVCDPGDMLGFNCETAGDRSILAQTVGSASTYVHDRRDPGNPWTARTAVDLLLAARAVQGGPPWALSGQTDALQYIETWETPGLTYLQRINRILAPRRGIVVRPIVRDHIPYLHVTTTSPVTLTTGAYTLPASVDQASVDLRGQPFRTVTRFHTDARAQLDILDLEGCRPWICRSLVYLTAGGGDLIADWTPAEEALWLAADAWGRTVPSLAHVFRRYRLNGTPPTAWIDNVRSTTTSDTYGVSGEDGTQTSDIAQGIAANSLRFTKLLPLYEGLDYTTSIPTASAGADYQKPKVFFRNGGTYIDVSHLWPIEVLKDEPAILLGETADDANQMRLALVENGWDLVVTIGITAPLPLRVRWRRDPANWPRTDSPRQRSYPIDAELRTLAAGTVLAEGTATATGGTILDERTRMRQALVLMRPWMEFAEIDLRWIESGLADVVDGFHPGVYVPSLIGADGTDTIGQVITRRSWDFTEEGLQTDYSTARINADLRGFSK